MLGRIVCNLQMGERLCFLHFKFPPFFLSPPKKETAGAIVGEGDWRISADCHFHLVGCPQLPPLYAQIQLRVSQSPLLFSVQPPYSANGSIAQTYCCYYLKLVSRVCLHEGFELFFFFFFF